MNPVCPAGGNVEMCGPSMAQLIEFPDETKAYVGKRAIPGKAPLERSAAAACCLARDASAHCTGVDPPMSGGGHARNFIPDFNTL